MRIRYYVSLDIESCILVVCCPPPLLIEVSLIALPDLKLRAIVVYSVGDVLRNRELETSSHCQKDYQPNTYFRHTSLQLH
jgi:hypothetical protein